MEKTDAYKKTSGAGKKWDGGGPGGPYGRGPGGPRRPPRGMDNVRGIDHSELFASLLIDFAAIFFFGCIFCKIFLPAGNFCIRNCRLSPCMRILLRLNGTLRSIYVLM